MTATVSIGPLCSNTSGHRNYIITRDCFLRPICWVVRTCLLEFPGALIPSVFSGTSGRNTCCLWLIGGQRIGRNSWKICWIILRILTHLWLLIWGCWTSIISVGTETNMSSFLMGIWTMIWEESRLLDRNLKELSSIPWLLSWKLKSQFLWFILSLMCSSISIQILGFISTSLFPSDLGTMIYPSLRLMPQDWRGNISGQVLILQESQPTLLGLQLFLKCWIGRRRPVKGRLFLRWLSSKTQVKSEESLWKTLKADKASQPVEEVHREGLLKAWKVSKKADFQPVQSINTNPLKKNKNLSKSRQ